MQNNGVVELFGDRGEPIQYRKLSARIPDFLETYKPSDGYAVIVDIADPVSLKPGLLRLYEAAIAAGKSFEECGLPKFSGQESLVYTAKLVNTTSEQLLCSRSAVVQVSEYKDHESGETAAVQRLLAALGFDGTVLDADEENDFKAQDKTSQPADPTRAANSEQQPSVDKPAEKAGLVEGNQSDSSVNQIAQPEDVPDAMVLQIQHLSAMKGVAIPKYDDLKSAKKALKTLQVA